MSPAGDHDPFEPDNHAVSHALLSRRRMLVAAGAGIAAGVGAAAWLGAGRGEEELADGVGAAANTPSPSATGGGDLCMLTTEQVEGPYYLDRGLYRRDIRERKAGVPLRLDLDVVDAATCQPLRAAAVEIWHCDAAGSYSGYGAPGSGPATGPSGRPGASGSPGDPSGQPPTGPPPSGRPTPSGAPQAGGPGGSGGSGGATPAGDRHEEPTDDLTFLRGMQVTGQTGKVRFVTIVPGWYAGRAVHIHTKVHFGGTRTADGYEGGGVVHTGQLYLPEQIVRRVAATPPYKRNATPRTKLADDPIHPGGGAAGGDLEVETQGDLSRPAVAGRPLLAARLRLGLHVMSTQGPQG